MGQIAFDSQKQLCWRGGQTQQRAGVRPCAVGALLCLDLLVLLGQSLPRLFRGQKNERNNASKVRCSESNDYDIRLVYNFPKINSLNSCMPTVAFS